MSDSTLPQKSPNVQLSRTGRAALAYANLFGWSVLPVHGIVGGKCTCGRADCPSPGKHPLPQNGVKDATRDLSVIRGWWHRWPLANVGIATGAASGFWVLDVDGTRGRDSLDELIGEHGPLPANVEALTGGGGWHLLFAYPAEGQALKNAVAVRPGLDVRACGGYILVAPSGHASGRDYVWEASSRPGEVPLAEAPEWLLNLVRPATGPQQAKPTSFWRELTEAGATEGQRNHAVATLAGHLLRRHVDPYVTLALVSAWNRSKNRPPLADDEVRRTVDSVASAELKRRTGGTDIGRH